MRIAKLIAAGMLGGGVPWVDVTAPDAEFAWLPFTIQQRGNEFRPHPSFDIQAQAGVTVAKTYYLNTVTGNDGNSGLTAALPKATWNHIQSLGDADRVIIQDGSVLLRASSSLASGRNIEVIGEGTVWWTAIRPVGAWTLDSGKTYTYKATVTGGEFISRIFDNGNLNVYGNPVRYAAAADAAGVEATAGSFFWAAGGTLYVHTLDGSDPTGNIDLQYCDSSAIAWLQNFSVYFKNIKFLSGAIVKNGSADGGAKAYFDGCEFHGPVQAHGLDECIFLNCVGEHTGDVLNYDLANTLVTNFVEINCDFGEILGSSSSQPSTSHYACRGVRIGGDYHDTTAQGAADVLGTWSWNLGCTFRNCTDGFYLSELGAKAWLDTCDISECSSYGIEANTATVYTRNVTLNGETTHGTITPY